MIKKFNCLHKSNKRMCFSNFSGCRSGRSRELYQRYGVGEVTRSVGKLLLINADVINQIPLRKNRIVDSLLTSPGTADSEVKDEKLGFVERPGIAAGMLVGVGKIFVVIDKKVEVL